MVLIKNFDVTPRSLTPRPPPTPSERREPTISQSLFLGTEFIIFFSVLGW